MNKKKAGTALISNLQTSVNLELTDDDQVVAASLGIVIAADLNGQIARATLAISAAQRLVVDAGYNLLAAKSKCAHGDFAAIAQAAGFTPTRASEAMRLAKFVTSRTDAERQDLLKIQPSKLQLLACADAEVVAELLEDGDLSDLSDLSVRGLRDKIKQLQAQLADSQISQEQAENEKSQILKQLKRRALADDNELVPLAVADMRAEVAALVKKGQLAVDSLHVMGREIADLGATAPEWMQPTARLALAGLLSVREQIDGCLAKYVQLTGEERSELATKPASMAFLSPQEIAEVASDWQRLVATHEHEAALREYERKKAHPKGKGRPAAEPVAPEAKKAKKG